MFCDGLGLEHAHQKFGEPGKARHTLVGRAATQGNFDKPGNGLTSTSGSSAKAKQSPAAGMG